MTAVSSGKTTRAAAEFWAYERIKENDFQIVKDQKLKSFARDWFIWD